MNIPANRKYNKTHEWFLIDGDVVTMGITQHAADELTDITYVELPAVGTSFGSGDAIGEVESVKATSEIYTAIAGEVIEINQALGDHPELINDEAFEGGWIIKIKPASTEPITALMDAQEYESHIKAG